MYVPHHFAVPAEDDAAAFVAAVGSAELVTYDGSRPVASLIPVLWDRTSGPHGRMLGHLARANPQWASAAPDALALAICTGPQGYVSPTWYASKAEHGRVVPTWNYVSVHLTGELRFHDDPAWLRDLVSRLTERHEGARREPWAVEDAPPRYVDGQLRAIVGVELLVASVEAKAKLSQNRSDADVEGVLRGLRSETGAEARALADLMAAQQRSE